MANRSEDARQGERQAEATLSMGIASVTNEYEQAFHALVPEWERIATRADSDLLRWPDAFQKIDEEEQELRARGTWIHGRDDFFGVLGLTRSEVRHSAMIAWLLDPCSRHGLGPRVLERVLVTAFGATAAVTSALSRARTRCEVQAGEGRIDILVEAPGLCLVIENKVDALEGDEQCDYYHQHFNGHDGARFVFLTPDGRKPSSVSGDAGDAFKTLSYRQLLDAIEHALGVTPQVPQTARGRHLVEDYVRTLKKEFR